MKRILALSGLILALGCLPFGALALGLGDIHLHSALGQKLDANIPVVGATRDSASGLKVELASPEQFKHAGVDRTGILQSLEFKVISGPHGYHVHVISSKPVKEPFLTFLVQAQWASGEVTRQYTVLLDPPNYDSSGGMAVSQASSSTSDRGSSSMETAGSDGAASQQGYGGSAEQGSISGAGSNYGPIRRGQTLWGIANQLTPGGPAETDQMMVAIYRANRHAFSGNINRLKAGQVLHIPGTDRIHAISRHDAIAAVKTANQRFSEQRAATSTAKNTETTADSERANAAADPSAEGGDEEQGAHLQLVAPDSTGDSGDDETAAPGDSDKAEDAAQVATLKSQLADAKADAKEAGENNDKLSSQVDDLKKQLDKTKRLLSVRDQRLNQLQNQVQQQQAQLDASSHSSAIDKIVAIITTPLFLIGLLIVIVLIVAFAVIRRQRGGSDPDAGVRVVSGSDRVRAGRAEEQSDVVEASGEETDGEPTITEIEPASADGEASDPIAEADFNIDYGLYDQAAEVVRKGIAADPDRDALKLKLFQVYFDSGDAAAFRHAAQEYASDWGADHPAEWEEVSAMGRQLVPDEPLFASGHESTGTPEPSETATLEVPAEPADELGDDWMIGSDTDTSEESPNGAEAAETIADSRDDALDFDLDIGEPVSTDDSATAESPSENESTALSDADQPDAESGDNEDKVQPESADVRATELDLGELEARLNPSDAAGDETNSALLDTQTEFEDAIRELSEFVDTNFPNEIDDASDKAEAGAGDSESMTERDIAPPPFEPAAGLSEEQEDDFADEDDADEMDTKLELARAYMDMGDPEGARGILEEVMEEGAPNHQEQARTLLDKVG